MGSLKPLPPQSWLFFSYSISQVFYSSYQTAYNGKFHAVTENYSAAIQQHCGVILFPWLSYLQFVCPGDVGYLYKKTDVLCLSVKELVSFPSMLLKPHQPSHYTEQRSAFIKRVLCLAGVSAKSLLVILIHVIFISKLRTKVIWQQLICAVL